MHCIHCNCILYAFIILCVNSPSTVIPISPNNIYFMLFSVIYESIESIYFISLFCRQENFWFAYKIMNL
ncbi:hypothetical protein GLOIN_2v1571854 [Rhizophagus irregularis DAOM 181602=DAOM 197198]|uniref:Uncharacterized protein n=1 Tax=Rhizophagus irregularis (strain DAOM 181602 / DAOM 197198 / MUCL 43194) TaxID=747089 RepID=A0A2P4QB24_RHIID|nr:hypothetical protein GLOIN_2v1571854 [Rhizophagus irregularis DAOM 181602=DAOM 197198]POG74818.1 hypothetical protein GLOIN_2v1571854 [Rhizophagus irregularis DAOM 181602=DAOM 197198]GET53878.1 hypothetical protein GLOIN_2v1571854 [Rhizophagus irregularis DAOM 181602=DAOM 197198]|eukprot:XP_025181684.1 hypothetical protein GLOIN_2v1571854 [Rhizophagus irregularis DAOM 181602=DAOM 197198]